MFKCCRLLLLTVALKPWQVLWLYWKVSHSQINNHAVQWLSLCVTTYSKASISSLSTCFQPEVSRNPSHKHFQLRSKFLHPSQVGIKKNWWRGLEFDLGCSVIGEYICQKIIYRSTKRLFLICSLAPTIYKFSATIWLVPINKIMQ
jgi:hypothetical protein